MTLDPNHSYGPLLGAVVGKSNRHDPVLINTPDWLDRAECAGAWAQADDATFKGEIDQFVRRYCNACPVRRECYAKGQEIGAVSSVWGGVWFTVDGIPAHNTKDVQC